MRSNRQYYRSLDQSQVDPTVPKEPSDQTPRQVFYAFAIALFVYGWLSVNIYLPVLPKLESVFDTSTASARLTVTIFLFGFSFAQLIWGPLCSSELPEP